MASCTAIFATLGLVVAVSACVFLGYVMGRTDYLTKKQRSE